MGLGPLHTVSLAEARKLAKDARTVQLAGACPLTTRQQARSEARLEPKPATWKIVVMAMSCARMGGIWMVCVWCWGRAVVAAIDACPEASSALFQSRSQCVVIQCLVDCLFQSLFQHRAQVVHGRENSRVQSN